jgi:ATP-dependent Zn protease
MHTTAHDTRTATAYHEAGHLTIACHYQLPIGTVTLHHHDGDGPRHTALPLEAPVAGGSEAAFQMLNLITCLIGGSIAEERYTGQVNSRIAEQDHEQAWRLAVEVADTDRGAEALMTWLTIRAEQDVNRLWNEITATAALLLERGSVTPEQAKSVVRELDRRHTPRPED